MEEEAGEGDREHRVRVEEVDPVISGWWRGLN